MKRIIKKSRSFCFTGIIFLLLFPPISFSQSNSGGLPGTFLRIGVGARAMGMGQAFTAVADDASAVYWNPAGLVGLNCTEIIGAYSILSLQRSYNFMAVAIPAGSYGSFGISYINFGVGSIEGRDFSGRLTEKFTNSENAVYFSWGFPLADNFSLGVNAKYLSHTLQNNQSSGFGVDAGIMYKFSDFLNIGAVFQDVASSVKWDTNSQLVESFPIVGRFGIAVRPPNLPLTLGVDYVQIQDQTATVNVGCEVNILQNGGIRAGLNNGTFSAGGFVSIPLEGYGLQTNYSFSQDPMDKSWTHRLSLRIKLNNFKLNTYQSATSRQQKISENKNVNGYLDLISPTPTARIIQLSAKYPDYAIINLGRKYGIQMGLIFGVYRIKQLDDIGNEEKVEIGTVKVVKVKEELSAIRVIEMKTGYSIKKGDILLKQKESQVSSL